MSVLLQYTIKAKERQMFTYASSTCCTECGADLCQCCLYIITNNCSQTTLVITIKDLQLATSLSLTASNDLRQVFPVHISTISAMGFSIHYYTPFKPRSQITIVILLHFSITLRCDGITYLHNILSHDVWYITVI